MDWLTCCLKLRSEHSFILCCLGSFFKLTMFIMVVEKSRGIRLAHMFQRYESFEEALHFYPELLLFQKEILTTKAEKLEQVPGARSISNLYSSLPQIGRKGLTAWVNHWPLPHLHHGLLHSCKKAWQSWFPVSVCPIGKICCELSWGGWAL